jgi:hypothetical protein
VTDYKKYALGQVENFLYDAMSTDATPQEIYDTIRGVVEDNYYTYKHQTSQAYELLALLNGNGKGHLTCDKDDSSPECKKSWSDFWQYTDEEIDEMCDKASSDKKTKICSDIYDDEMISAGYVKSDDGLWVHPKLGSSTKKDKVKSWVLPVDDDYNITFPEDLLEQTGWKEGDTLQWIDQGDGSFKMIKKEN